MELAKVVSVDETKCINCHQCISVCPVKFCNDGSKDYVEVNKNLCIGCGECVEVCNHEARKTLDDFDIWGRDLSTNSKMVAIAAPAVASNFPDTYLNLNGWLKSKRVEAVFDVSFGAELTIKTYLEYVKNNSPKCVLAQPCPAIVSYIQIYKPELIKYLAPADSPMMHTMKMIRKFYPQYKNHKILIISPCAAKKREFDEVGIGDYNVTMKSLINHFNEKGINLNNHKPEDYDNPPAERAVLFSTPGGLLRTAMRENPDIINVARKIEGPDLIYHYLENLEMNISNGFNPILVDCLNCELGCNGGTGTVRDASMDEVEYRVEKRNREMQENYKSKFGKKASLRKIQKAVDSHWENGLYERKYKNLQNNFDKAISIPSQSELDQIYKKMNKTKKEDYKDCSACGYNKCEKMAIAIYNGLNKKENCHHYLENIQEYIDHNLSIIHKFAKGDLTVEFFDEGDSDIAKLFKEFNEALYQFRQLITQLQTVVQATENSSIEISGTSQKISENTTQQSYKAGEVISTIQNLAEKIIETHQSADKAAEVANQAGQTATAGGEIVKGTVMGISKIGEVVHQAADVIEKLGNSTDEIDKIIQVIDDIADQTNLLALNAAIEAARAGEQGRGFAVVADEVRKLAEKTTKATSEISSLIKQIIDETHIAVKSIESGKEEVGKGEKEALQAGKSLEKIIKSSIEVVTEIEGVAKASEEQSGKIENINNCIEAIKSVTEDSSAGTAQIAIAAVNLTELTTKLNELVSNFKVEANGESFI